MIDPTAKMEKLWPYDSIDIRTPMSPNEVVAALREQLTAGGLRGMSGEQKAYTGWVTDHEFNIMRDERTFAWECWSYPVLVGCIRSGPTGSVVSIVIRPHLFVLASECTLAVYPAKGSCGRAPTPGRGPRAIDAQSAKSLENLVHGKFARPGQPPLAGSITILAAALGETMAILASGREGRVAKAIEQQTAKIPSDAFLWAAFASIGISLAARMLDKKDTSQFIGQWAPTLLILGLYNKIVKTVGSE